MSCFMVLFPFCKEVSDYTDRFVVNGGHDIRPDVGLSGTDGLEEYLRPILSRAEG